MRGIQILCAGVLGVMLSAASATAQLYSVNRMGYFDLLPEGFSEFGADGRIWCFSNNPASEVQISRQTGANGASFVPLGRVATPSPQFIYGFRAAVSPDGTKVAFVSRVEERNPTTQVLSAFVRVSVVNVADLTGAAVTPYSAQIEFERTEDQTSFGQFQPRAMLWANSNELFVLCKNPRGSEVGSIYTQSVYRVNVATGATTRVWEYGQFNTRGPNYQGYLTRDVLRREGSAVVVSINLEASDQFVLTRSTLSQLLTTTTPIFALSVPTETIARPNPDAVYSLTNGVYVLGSAAYPPAPIVYAPTGEIIGLLGDDDPFWPSPATRALYNPVTDEFLRYGVVRLPPPNQFYAYKTLRFKVIRNNPVIGCSNPSNVAGPNQSSEPDDVLTADDIIVFLSRFFSVDIRSDVASANQEPVPDGQFTADDIIVFLSRYFAGC